MKKLQKIGLTAMLFSSALSLATPLLNKQTNVHAEEAQEITRATPYRNVMYYGDWSIWGGEGNFYPKDIAADQLTHLNYAFLDFDSNGDLQFTDADAATEVSAGETEVGWNNARSGLLNAIQHLRAENKNLKIGVSLGGWSKSGDFSEVAANPTKRKRFVENITKFLKYTNMDFVDVDWEYPADVRQPDLVDNKNDEGTPNATPEDKENYILLLNDIRAAIDKQGEELGKTYELSVALPASQDKLNKGIDIERLFDVVDFANIMTYDMNGAWSETSGHQTALYGNPDDPNYDSGLSVDQTVRYLQANGASSEKIVIGAAFYTRGWNEVEKGDNENLPGLFQSAKKNNKDADGTLSYGAPNKNPVSIGDGGRAGGVWPYRDINQLMNQFSGLKEYWDDTAKAPYLYSETTGELFTYDNVKSINYKTQYVKEHELGGVISWMQSQDKETTSTKRDELTKAIKNGLFGTAKLPENEIVTTDLNVEVSLSTYSENSKTGYELVVKNNEKLTESNTVLSAIEFGNKTIKLPKLTLALNTNEVLAKDGHEAGTVTSDNGLVTVDLSSVYDAKELKPGTTYKFRLASNATNVSIDHIDSITLSQRIVNAGPEISQQTIYGDGSSIPTPTPTPEPEEKEAPSIPTNLAVKSVTQNSVTLNWSANDAKEGVTSYEIYRNGTRVATSTSPSFVDTGLTADTTYTYQVTAVNVYGTSAKSQQVTAKTSSEEIAQEDAWVVGKNYSVGDIVTYMGSRYRCVQAHQSNSAWTPTAAISLWQKIS
jgi:chitinase